MNIISAIKDKNLFRPFLEDKQGDISSWNTWLVALRVLYGLPIRSPASIELIKKCTGRDPQKLPKEGFSTVLLLVGRRGGKSKIAGLIAGFESCLSGKECTLSPGEMGLVSVVSPTKLQSQIVKSYIRASLSSPMLEREIIQEDKDGFELDNKIKIQILTGDFRSVRGFSQIAVICDEICFMGLTEESKIRSDGALIQAIRPAVATTGGKIIAISTKYAKKGWAYQTWKANWGNDNGRILVWDADSKTMNPTLPQSVIDEAMQEDAASARSEFLGEWREDITAFLPREVIEAVVIKGRKELLPNDKEIYACFVDMSGGRSDCATIGVGHRKERKVIVDYLKSYRPPFSPYAVIQLMAKDVKRFGIRTVVGDNYAAEYTKSAFEGEGLIYKKSEKVKSQLFLELLPRLCSGEIEMLDDELAVTQLCLLERRVRSGGRDIVCHPTNGKDDSANAIAGLSDIVSAKQGGIGTWR